MFAQVTSLWRQNIFHWSKPQRSSPFPSTLSPPYCYPLTVTVVEGYSFNNRRGALKMQSRFDCKHPRAARPIKWTIFPSTRITYLSCLPSNINVFVVSATRHHRRCHYRGNHGNDKHSDTKPRKTPSTLNVLYIN